MREAVVESQPFRGRTFPIALCGINSEADVSDPSPDQCFRRRIGRPDGDIRIPPGEREEDSGPDYFQLDGRMGAAELGE